MLSHARVEDHLTHAALGFFEVIEQSFALEERLGVGDALELAFDVSEVTDPQEGFGACRWLVEVDFLYLPFGAAGASQHTVA